MKSLSILTLLVLAASAQAQYAETTHVRQRTTVVAAPLPVYNQGVAVRSRAVFQPHVHLNLGVGLGFRSRPLLRQTAYYPQATYYQQPLAAPALYQQQQATFLRQSQSYYQPQAVAAPLYAPQPLAAPAPSCYNGAGAALVQGAGGCDPALLQGAGGCGGGGAMLRSRFGY